MSQLLLRAFLTKMMGDQGGAAPQPAPAPQQPQARGGISGKIADFFSRHDNLRDLVQGAGQGLQMMGEAKNDPRYNIAMKDLAVRQAMAQAMMGYRQQQLGEQTRHHGATEATGTENAATRQFGTDTRAVQGQQQQGVEQSKLGQGQQRINQAEEHWQDKVSVGPLVQGANGKPQRVLMDNQGNEVGRIDNALVPATMPTVRSSTEEHITRDPVSGAILSTPATNTSVSQKVMPGAAPSAAPGAPGAAPAPSAPPVPGPGAGGGGRTHQVGQGAYPMTSTTRTMIEMAPTVKYFTSGMRDVIDLMDKNHIPLGPLAGRVQELWQGKIGANDPIFAQLGAQKGLLATALMKMHLGNRGGIAMIPEFKKMFDSAKQDPANIKAVLDQLDAYADHLTQNGADMLNGKSPWEVHGQKAAPTSTGGVRKYNPATGQLE